MTPNDKQRVDELLDAVAKRQEQWERLFAAHRENLLHLPEVQAMREEGLMPKMAVLMTRQTALEEQFHELRILAVETYTAMKEVLELLRRDPE
jgi:hypothetical protein